MRRYNYYYNGKNQRNFNFVKMPTAILKGDEFDCLSHSAKILYGLLLDRMNLSTKNNWSDEEGRVFIIYSIKDIAKDLKVSIPTATKTLQELDDNKGIGLVEKKRRGLGKASLLYVLNFMENLDSKTDEGDINVNADVKEEIIEGLTEEKIYLDNVVIFNETNKNTKPEKPFKQRVNTEFKSFKFLNSNILNSRIKENEIQELKPFKPNQTNINKTNINNNNIYYNTIYPINQSSSIIYNNTTESKDRLMDEYAYYEKLFKKNIAYKDFMESTDPNLLVDEILNTMLDVVTTNKKTVRVNCEDKPVEIVKSIFCKIKSYHISYILESIRKTDSDIRNVKAYLITAIYNSYLTYDAYLTVKVNYDMSTLNSEKNTQNLDEKRRKKLNLPEENHDYDWDEINRRNLEKLEITLEESEKEAEKLDKPIEKIKTEQEKWEEEYLKELEERIMKSV